MKLDTLISSYDPKAPLAEASTIPAAWYTDDRVYRLEQETVFATSWLFAARANQLAVEGNYVTLDIAGEPIIVVKGNDARVRGFFNVCRHHAAAVMTEAEGKASQLRCPYHGWTYSLEGELKGTTDFAGVCNFERSANGLVPVETSTWENWVFVRMPNNPPLSLEESLGAGLISQIRLLALENLHWLERRHYMFDCNWKVFVDNYLDGGYHVPHLHKGLDSVLDYSKYMIEVGERFCLQWSPMVSEGAEQQTGAVRKGERALYYWIYPNFMINWYDGAMDTNLVIPRGTAETEVIFDFYFPDTSDSARAANLASIEVGHRIQQEDMDICKSVQRGLSSRSYNAGRLSVRREGGEHLFHKLLHADLRRGLPGNKG